MERFRLVMTVMALMSASPDVPPVAEERSAARTVAGPPGGWKVPGWPERTLLVAPGQPLLLRFEELATQRAFVTSRHTRWVHDGSTLWLEVGAFHTWAPQCDADRKGECGPSMVCGDAGHCAWPLGGGLLYVSTEETLARTRRDLRPRVPPPMPTACWGERLVDAYCIACHAKEPGIHAPAPSFGDFRFGRARHLTDGRAIVADRDYFRAALLAPQRDVVVGYESVNMPPFRFSDRQMDAIEAYVRQAPKRRVECRFPW